MRVLIIHGHLILTKPRLVLASESYGGHLAVAFVRYFDEQNSKIDEGTVKGEKIVISALMINK
jgi:hypothetical protein